MASNAENFPFDDVIMNAGYGDTCAEINMTRGGSLLKTSVPPDRNIYFIMRGVDVTIGPKVKSFKMRHGYFPVDDSYRQQSNHRGTLSVTYLRHAWPKEK